MTLKLLVDAEDRLHTVGQINAIASRQRGVLVVHAPPIDPELGLATQLLQAIGFSHHATAWPRSSRVGWELARAWLRGFEISHVVVYGGWRLSSATVKILARIASEDQIEIEIVTVASARSNEPDLLKSLPTGTVEELIARYADQQLQPDFAEPETVPRLPKSLPTLPPVDVTRFLAECAGCLQQPGDWQSLLVVFDRERALASRELVGPDRPELILASLERRIRRSHDYNGLLVAIRALQNQALRDGWHLQVPMRTTSLAAAMSLATADTTSSVWPRTSVVDPQLQALSTVMMISDGAPLGTIVKLTHTELADDLSLIAGDPVDGYARAILRAHLWLQRHRKFHDSGMLFTSARGRRLTGSAARAMLDAVDPDAVRASEQGPDRLGDALRRLTSITDLRTNPGTSDEEPADTRRVLRNARYGDWLVESGGIDAESWTGLPGRMSDERFVDSSSAYRPAIDAALGFPAPPGRLLDAGTIDRPPMPFDEQKGHDVDPIRLHSLLLRTGGTADRQSLLRGFSWSAERLDAAAELLADRLEKTAEVLARPLDGRIELRVRTDYESCEAVKTVLARTDCDHGPSLTSMRLLWQLTKRSLPAFQAGESGLTEDEVRSAYAELQDRGLVTTDRRGMVCLTDLARSGLCMPGFAQTWHCTDDCS